MAEKPTIITSLRAVFTLGSAAVMGVFCIYLFAPTSSGIDPITTATVQPTSPSADKASESATPEELPLADKNLNEALEALDRGDIQAVIAARDGLDENNADRMLLTWLLAISGQREMPISELRNAQELLIGWPNQSTIAKNLETSMARDPLEIMRLRLSLNDDVPKSFQAAYAVAKTYVLTRNHEKARQLIIPFWHSQILSRGDELRVLEIFDATLTERDHEIRFFNMMSRNRITAAGRIANHFEWNELHEAWAAVIRGQKTALAKMDKLSDDEKKTAAYALMRTEYLRRAGKDDEAIAVLEELSNDLEFLINSDAWWDERRILSRNKFEMGDAQAAYDLVSTHLGSSDEKQIDAAFHAGWYALRGLNKPEDAVVHFKKIIEMAKGDISKARGHYWLGRALDNGAAAQNAFKEAASFDTTFYGWLAREELGLASNTVTNTNRSIALDQNSNAPLNAAKRLMSLNQNARARALYLAMGWSWTDPVALKFAAQQASNGGDHFAALKIAKAAQWRGIDMGTLTHPLGAISDATGIAPVDHALAYSIARQESEFNIGAVSKANAKGLMQVLPSTAKEMARKISVAYEPTKLTTDANYNARMGVEYLNQQLEKFGGSFILTFAAYNAGPSRAKEWIERFGDPRGKPLYDVIDWVEKIPFPETRSYVQRILENLQVYKTKLGQETSITQDLRFGTKRSN